MVIFDDSLLAASFPLSHLKIYFYTMSINANTKCSWGLLFSIHFFSLLFLFVCMHKLIYFVSVRCPWHRLWTVSSEACMSIHFILFATDFTLCRNGILSQCSWHEMMIMQSWNLLVAADELIVELSIFLFTF